MEQALSGVKVLDLTHYIAGPYCTKMLADYGAEVIKIEKPGSGDGARMMAPFFEDDPHPEKSGLFLYLNTNKRGITLNLKSEKGKRIFKELVEEPHLNERGFFEMVTHPEAGTHPYIVAFAKFSKTPVSIRMSAPCLGEHNRYVFGELLGMSHEKMAQLEEQGIIGTKPSEQQQGGIY